MDSKNSDEHSLFAGANSKLGEAEEGGGGGADQPHTPTLIPAAILPSRVGEAATGGPIGHLCPLVHRRQVDLDVAVGSGVEAG